MRGKAEQAHKDLAGFGIEGLKDEKALHLKYTPDFHAKASEMNKNILKSGTMIFS